jgi:Transcriptional activator of glycolytic enzymes/Centromere DNA-binding protein complex CBF3 subunit, domain 2
MQALAGFSPRMEGQYFIPRAKIMPPQVLLSQIFPSAESWLDRFKTRENIESDMAGEGLLQLLLQLHIILLQDSTILKQRYPGHEIWRHPVFSLPDYDTFAKELLSVLKTQEEPHDVLLRRALPCVSQHLTVLQQSISQEIRQGFQTLEPQLANIQNFVSDITTGKVTFIMQSAGSIIDPKLLSDTATASNSQGSLVRTDIGLLEPQAASSASTSPIDATFDTVMPSYSMNRSLKTVPELWQEWTVGICGGPPVSRLETRWGSKWRQGQKERKHFSRRKVIIDEILRQAAASASSAIGNAQEVAVHELEGLRKKGGMSLTALGVYIARRKP